MRILTLFQATNAHRRLNQIGNSLNNYPFYLSYRKTINHSGDIIWRGIHFSRDTYFRWNFLFPYDSVARAGLPDGSVFTA